MSQIGKNIKKIRNVKGLSQQAFAELFDLTRGNISSYEEFRAEPRIEVIIKIAKYFGIPLEEFVEKNLSVNNLLHYNTNLVIETEKLKINQQLVRIPYVSTPYIQEYVSRHSEPDFIQQLPVIIVPDNSNTKLIAIELEDPNTLPAGFDFRNNDILIFEQVKKENVHCIQDKLGMMINEENLFLGIYKTEDKAICLILNDWVKYPFRIDSDICYWLLRASYRQE